MSEASGPVQAAYGRILELRLDYVLLDAPYREKTRLRVSLWCDGLPLQVIPREGWLALEPAQDSSVW